ncbi:MAG: hypothetical protein J6T40_00630 [Clostridiales bacterium]|nr:hypothetical protein [Clostridiales bacterium]
MFIIDMLFGNYGNAGIFLGVFLLLVGIIILLRKDRATKFLGIWLIFEAVSNFLSALIYKLNWNPSWLDHKAWDVSSVVSNVRACLSLNCVLFLLLYAYARYHSKAFIPALIVKCVHIFVCLFSHDILSVQQFYSLSVEQRESIEILSQVLLLVVIAAITFYAFFKNREKEERMKMLFWFPFLQLICSIAIAIGWIRIINSSYGGMLAVVVFSIVELLIPVAAAAYIVTKAPGKKMYNSTETEGSNG